MPERASVNELLQFGLESTLGVAVAASKQMALFEMVATGELDLKPHAGEGRKQSVVVLPNKDFVTVKWSTKGNTGDALSYTEAPYIFSSLMGRPTPCTVGTNGKSWTFDAPLQGSPANPSASFSVEQGQAAHAHKFAGLVFSGITIKGTRDGVTATGDAFAQILSTGITITASPTKLLLDPIL